MCFGSSVTLVLPLPAEMKLVPWRPKRQDFLLKSKVRKDPLCFGVAQTTSGRGASFFSVKSQVRQWSMVLLSCYANGRLQTEFMPASECNTMDVLPFYHDCLCFLFAC
jgi:hypothetical protein